MELLEMLASSAALFIGNICTGMGVGTQDKAVDKAIVDAVFNAFGKDKQMMALSEISNFVDKENYIIENISLICEGVNTDGLKNTIMETMKTKAKIGISSIDSKEAKVTAFVLLVKKVINPAEEESKTETNGNYV